MKRIKKKPQSDITKEKLQGSILITIMCMPVFYYTILSFEALERPFGSRFAEAIVGTMLDIAPPLLWTFLLLCIFLFEIGRLSIQYLQEKKAEKAQIDE